MRLARAAVFCSAALIVGGCGAHRQSHVRTFGPQDRAWWHPDAHASDIYVSANSGNIVVSDALGAACIRDPVAYAMAVREQQAQLATVPSAD